MNEHYYSEVPVTKSEPFLFRALLRGHEFSFVSDAGVFSKRGIDFGTQLLIQTVSVNPSAKKMLDIGCGYGPIGICFAYFFPNLTVDMIDINTRAVLLSQQNIALNQLKNAQAIKSNRLEAVRNERYDIILSNPPIRTGKENIFCMYREAEEVLNIGGSLWIVIQKKQGAASTIKALEQMFETVETMTKKKGYFIICAKK